MPGTRLYCVYQRRRIHGMIILNYSMNSFCYKKIRPFFRGISPVKERPGLYFSYTIGYLTNSLGTFFTRTDPDTSGQIQDEYLAVPDLSGAGSLDDRLDRRLNEIFVDRDLQLHLTKQITGFLDTTVILINSDLTAMAQDIEYRDQIDIRRL